MTKMSKGKGKGKVPYMVLYSPIGERLCLGIYDVYSP